MYDTEVEITTAIKEKEGELDLLYARMDTDYDLFALTAYEVKDEGGNTRKGYQAYTSSQPRNFFDKVLDGLNRAALTIQILLPEDASETDRRKASKGELVLFGALAAMDRRLAKRGEPPLREGLGYFMCLRGLYALKALVYQALGGETIFEAVPWDPRHVTWEMGPDGIIWAAYKWRASRAQIQSEYGLEIKGKSAEVIDFWDQERNAVLVEGVFSKQPTQHNIGHVPVLVRFVGSMPTVQGNGFEAKIEQQGDSVWGASSKLYEPHNKHISSIMERYERSLTGSLWHKSKGGVKKIEGDPYRTYTVVPLDSDLDEEIGHLDLPPAPAEAAALLGIISNDIQQSTLPYPLAYGGTQQAMSGVAFSMLSDATRSVYNPRTGAMAQAYSWLCEEILIQYTNRKKGMGKVALRGYQSEASKEKQYFTVEAGPTDLDSEWFVHVRVEPRMPRDEEKEIAMALAATQRRGPEDIPLLSKSTARETILLLQDPDAEEAKALAEMGKALPPILAARIALAMKERGDVKGAEMVMALLGQKPAPGQAAPQLPPPLIEAIVKVLTESGERELASAFVDALAGAPGGAQAPAPAPMPAPMPAGQEPVPVSPAPTVPFEGGTPEMMGVPGGGMPPGMV